MSTYVFMKVLESAPYRYDRGIRILSRGRIADVYRAVAERVAKPGRRILDIGCGTGGVALACAERGATVVGIDANAGMLEVARAKTVPKGAGGSVEWIELGAVEIEDRFEERSFDAVASCLVFSELSPEERAYVLRVVRTRLEPGGEVVLADEVVPKAAGRRLWHRLKRIPLAALTYVLTQTTTRAVEDLGALLREAGFEDVVEQRPGPGDFSIVHGVRPKERS